MERVLSISGVVKGGANAPKVSFNSYNGHNMKWYARHEVGLLCTEGAPQVALPAYLDPGYWEKKAFAASEERV
jgi:hypothetical protein